jgi:hypothetical protein
MRVRQGQCGGVYCKPLSQPRRALCETPFANVCKRPGGLPFVWVNAWPSVWCRLVGHRLPLIAWTGVCGRHNLTCTRHHRCLLKLAVCWSRLTVSRIRRSKVQAKQAAPGQASKSGAMLSEEPCAQSNNAPRRCKSRPAMSARRPLPRGASPKHPQGIHPLVRLLGPPGGRKGPPRRHSRRYEREWRAC